MARTKHTDPGLTFESVMNLGGKAKRSAVTEGKKKPKTPAKTVSALNKLVTRKTSTVILNPQKKRKRDNRTILSVEDKLSIRDRFVQKVRAVNNLGLVEPTWKQYASVLKNLGHGDQTKDKVSKWAKGSRDKARPPSNIIVKAMMESLELSGEEEKVKFRFTPAATSNSEPAQEPESDQSEKDEADGENDSESDVTITAVNKMKSKKMCLSQGDIRASLFTPISDVTLGAFIMFLARIDVSCEEFVDVTLSEADAQGTVDGFHSFCAKKELRLNCQKRDISAYKLSVKRHLSKIGVSWGL